MRASVSPGRVGSTKDELGEAQVLEFGELEPFVTAEDRAGKFVGNEDGLLCRVEKNWSPVLAPVC